MKKRLLKVASGIATVSVLLGTATACDFLTNIFGKKETQTYTVKYVANSGQTYQDAVVDFGKIPQKPEDPAKEGYAFDGWYLEDTFQTEYAFDYALDADTVLYADYAELFYTVSYVTNGGTTVESETCGWGKLPVKPENPQNGELSFIGWYLDEELTKKYDFATALNTDTTLYAYFSEAIPVSTAEELANIANAPSGKYILVNDINLGNYSWKTIPDFSGELDGNGYKIYNVALNETLSSPQAYGNFDLQGGVLFAKNSGTLKNVTLDDFTYILSINCYFCTDWYHNVYLYAGSLVGENSGEVVDCKAMNGTVKVHGYAQVYRAEIVWLYGGLAGRNTERGLIANGVSFISFIGEAECSFPLSYARSVTLGVAGIAGSNYGSVTDCTATLTSKESVVANGNWASDQTVAVNASGLIRHNEGVVKNCSATVDLKAVKKEGDHGSVRFLGAGASGGNSSKGVIENCFVDGKIEETAGNFNVVGLAGFCTDNSGIIRNSYTDVDMKTTSLANDIGALFSCVAGFVGYNRSTAEIRSSYSSGNIVSTVGGKGTGGFAAVNENLIIGCFCAGNVTVTATDAKYGAFVVTDTSDMLGKCYYNTNATFTVNEEVVTEFETVIGVQGKTLTELCSSTLLVDIAYWETSIWKIDGVNLPVLL